MTPPDPLAENLKHIRTQRGWTHDDAANATGLDAQVLVGIERGSTFLSRSRIDTLADRLGVDVRDLLEPR